MVIMWVSHTEVGTILLLLSPWYRHCSYWLPRCNMKKRLRKIKITIIILSIISSPQVRLAPCQGHRLVQLRLHRVRVVGEQVGGPERSLCLTLKCQMFRTAQQLQIDFEGAMNKSIVCIVCYFVILSGLPTASAITAKDADSNISFQRWNLSKEGNNHCHF